MGVSGALFDMVKLLDISKNVISRYDAQTVYNETKKWASKYDTELEKILDKDLSYTMKVLGMERGNAKPRKDIAKWSDIRYQTAYMFEELYEKAQEEYEYQTITDKNEIKAILENYLTVYDEQDEKQTWFDKIKDVAEKLGYAREVKEYKLNPENYPKGHVGDVSTVLRVSLTKRANTPDLYEIMKILGKDVIQKRYQEILSK